MNLNNKNFNTKYPSKSTEYFNNIINYNLSAPDMNLLETKKSSNPLFSVWSPNYVDVNFQPSQSKNYFYRDGYFYPL
jgi:hypothetical protein